MNALDRLTTQQFLADYQRKWFGDSWKNRSFAYWALALGGEVGEFAESIVAKPQSIAEELADIGVYMYLMAEVFGHDLDDAMFDAIDPQTVAKGTTVNSSVYWLVAYNGKLQNAYKKMWRDGTDLSGDVWGHLIDLGQCVHILALQLSVNLSNEIRQKTIKNDKKYSGRSEAVIPREPPEPKWLHGPALHGSEDPAGLQ